MLARVVNFSALCCGSQAAQAYGAPGRIARGYHSTGRSQLRTKSQFHYNWLVGRPPAVIGRAAGRSRTC